MLRRAPQIVFLPRHGGRLLEPGDDVDWDIRLIHVTPDRVRALEVSVLWRTEGKGDEEISVHHFERHVALAPAEPSLLGPYRGATTLPDTPLSYHGRILRIVWSVRARLFFDRGREIMADQVFQLGQARPAPPPTTDAVADEAAVDALEPTGEM